MYNNKVFVIQHNAIKSLDISVKECMGWVEESFRMKNEAQLPAKISVHPQGNDFFTSMPCYLPKYKQFGIKIVSRIAERSPSLSSEILLYDSENGNLIAVLDGDWITTMRTGAVAALSVRYLQKKSVNTYSFIGLGNTARATALCLLEAYAGRSLHFRLLRYKQQAELFIERFREYPHATFEIIDSVEELIGGAEVIISCVTEAVSLLCPDDSLFQKGVLLVPVHTRGFQNCDLFFDKVYGDDVHHVKGFRYFEKFKAFDEFSRVLSGQNPGRVNDEERIIVYNIGLGLHDIVFAHKIYNKLKENLVVSFTQIKETEKFWI